MKEQEQTVGVFYFLMAIAIVSVLILTSGCSTKIEWYENGQMKSYREGFNEFSDGKSFLNPSFIGK